MYGRNGSRQQNFAQSSKLCFSLLVILGILCASVLASEEKSAGLWEPVDWIFRNPDYSGNPFDIIAKATFSHLPTGQKLRTELFYAGDNNWKLRFTGTQTGRWSFITESNDPELNDLKGQIDVQPNPGVPGFFRE